MYDFSNAHIDQLVVHKIGNKANGHTYFASQSLVELDSNPMLEGLLNQYFFKHFKGEELYHFDPSSDDEMYSVKKVCKSLFDPEDNFMHFSIKLLQRLHEKSDHPKIKAGDMYLARLKNCQLGDELTDAIGIFKAENKSHFLKTHRDEMNYVLSSEEGINIEKLDKGAIIFNTLEEDGYRVLMVDTASKNHSEAVYWKKHFLNVEQVQDEFYQTMHQLELCQQFCNDVLSEEIKADKTEQLSFLNKSLDYFSNNAEFVLEDFNEVVLEDPKMIEEFSQYAMNQQMDTGQASPSQFGIAPSAVQTLKKKFKNQIKLDTQIEIKLKPTNGLTYNEFIEKGYDGERGMHYYMVFFNEEK